MEAKVFAYRNSGSERISQLSNELSSYSLADRLISEMTIFAKAMYKIDNVQPQTIDYSFAYFHRFNSTAAYKI